VVEHLPRKCKVLSSRPAMGRKIHIFPSSSVSTNFYSSLFELDLREEIMQVALYESL
jgi:hypothetical protein